MEKEYYNIFNLEDQSLHFINKKNNPRILTENPPFTSFGMSTKSRSIKVFQKIGVKSNYDADEKNFENIPFFIKSIKGNNNIIIYFFL